VEHSGVIKSRDIRVTAPELTTVRLSSPLAGVRLDYVDGQTRVPTEDLVGYHGTDLDSGARVLNWSVFGSLILKPTQDSSFYVTYNRTNGFQGDSNFGGLIVYATNNDAAGHNHSVNSGILDNLSQLYEAGYKVTLFKQALFFSIDGFYQTRIEAPTNTTGQRAEVHWRGLEVDLDYRPAKQVRNFTYLLANYHQISSAFEQTGNYLDAYPAGFIVDGKSGTGVGSQTFMSSRRGSIRCLVHRKSISTPTQSTRLPWRRSGERVPARINGLAGSVATRSRPARAK
jgi:hypothetical protein